MEKSILQKTKKRYWAFVAYPESVPEDWVEILQKNGLPVAISPLHDMDIDPDGKPKKIHWHVILCYNGPQTYNAVKNLTASINSPAPIPLESVKGYYRYLTHKDNPEKHQYSEDKIIHLNGFNPLTFIELSRSEILNIKKSILETIRENAFVEYSALVDWLDNFGPIEHLDVVINNTLFFDKYLTSRRHMAGDPKNETVSIKDLAKNAGE